MSTGGETVIPPLLVDKFSCLGSGLLYEGHERVPPEMLRVLLLPSASGEPISDRARPKPWWVAQTLFYELPHPKAATITTMRASLESAIRTKTLKLPQNIKDMETKANKEFKALNAKVRAKTTTTSKATATVTSKANSTPAVTVGKGKAKAAPALEKVAEKPKKKIVPVLGTAVEKPTKKAAGGMEKVKPPKAEPVKKTTKKEKGTLMDRIAGVPPPPPKRAVKRSASALYDRDGDVTMQERPIKGRKVTHNSSPTRPAYRESTLKEESDEEFYPYEVAYEDGYDFMGGLGESDDVADDYGAGPSNQPAVPTGTPTDAASGQWEITCEAIRNGWESASHGQFTLNTVRTNQGTLEADFDFSLLRGFMRSKTVQGRKNDAFYVTYEWAGEEDEGPIEPPNPHQSGYMYFTWDNSGAGGSRGYPTVKGSFSGGCVGDAEFHGRWIGPPKRNQHCWQEFSEEAYERARIGRWH